MLNRAELVIVFALLELPGDWRPGLPPYLAVRHVLNNASDVDSAIGILEKLPLASSRSIMLCDARQAAYVELVGADVRVGYAPETVHTNHFLHPDLEPRDEVNVFARNSSVRRLEVCRHRLAATPPARAEDHLDLLSTPPICVPDDGDISRDRTVAAVVMLPAAGRLYVRPGDPSRNGTQAFALSDS